MNFWRKSAGVMLIVLIVLILWALATGDAWAKGGHERVDVCFPHPTWHVKSVPPSAVNGMIQAGAFVIDSEHPCPPADSIPQPDPEAHNFYLPNMQRDCTLCIWEFSK